MRVGVDIVFGHVVADVIDEASGGIDLHRGTDNGKNIGFLADVDGFGDEGHVFAKPDDMGAELRAFFAFVAEVEVAAPVLDVFGVEGRADFEEFAVEVEDLFGACALVEVIYVLGDNMHVEIFLELGEGDVAEIGFDFVELATAHVIKI